MPISSLSRNYIHVYSNESIMVESWVMVISHHRRRRRRRERNRSYNNHTYLPICGVSFDEDDFLRSHFWWGINYAWLIFSCIFLSFQCSRNLQIFMMKFSLVANMHLQFTFASLSKQDWSCYYKTSTWT